MLFENSGSLGKVRKERDFFEDSKWEKETTVGTDCPLEFERQETLFKWYPLFLQAVCATVESCHFAACVLEDAQEELPCLLAVSDGFEVLTGYGRTELQGKDGRLLCLAGLAGLADQDFLPQLNSVDAEKDIVFQRAVHQRKTGELFASMQLLEELPLPNIASEMAGIEKSNLLLVLQIDLEADGAEDVDGDAMGTEESRRLLKEHLREFEEKLQRSVQDEPCSSTERCSQM
mmetsp:Transcript_4837/g.8638  ORF Transcript_4837/g.8638 Transcript_4837/m.8638 type:complete len:232 (-) Transcript_4837:206-901(-)